jgi:DNA-binding SARP family transcriptional activator
LEDEVVVRVRLLGPVDVLADDGPLEVRGLRRRAVLATLALQAGEVVSTDRLMDAVWGEDAPSTAMNTLQSHVSHLRRVLGSKTAIVTRPPGYVLDLGPDGTDVRLAERLLREGAQSADPAQGVRLLQSALELWRGRPLADVTGLAWLEEQVASLDVLWVRVRRALADAMLAAGQHAQLVPVLQQMVADNRLDEQLCAQLMLALYRSGRQADALAAYTELRAALDSELGIDPSQVLRDLETAILRQDLALDAPAPAVMALAGPVPAQLPPAVPAFAGRDAELASLDATLPAAGGAPGPGAVVITAVSGTAGVGKTALAVYWAHQVSAQFPDGQLYVNLRGYDPAAAAVSQEAAVRGFLDAFGLPAARIPDGLAAQAGLYRSMLAGRRVLVVLDNALDAEQVRPLLPGSPGCLAIVTSRSHLTGLVAAEGAYPLTLDLLTAAGARDFLARRLGADRVASEFNAVSDIIAGCARLPLALAIAAARAATHPGFPLAAIAAELREATRALDPFDGGDLATDVRAVFSWSYRTLSADAARLFRLLGLPSGADVAIGAVASLAAVPLGRARVLLGELTDAHLLTEHRPGRYAFHDLLRAYAAELARGHDSAGDCAAAVRRFLEHYLHTSNNAATVMEPHFHSIVLDPPRPGVVVGELATAKEALGWFTAEQANQLAAVQLAASYADPTRTWQLAWAQSIFLMRAGLWHEQARACQAGLDAARTAGDDVGQAHCLHRIALGRAQTGRTDDAGALFQEALWLFEASGDLVNQAIIHGSMAWLSQLQQRNSAALDHCVRAQELFRAAGHRVGQALVLNDIGYAQALVGNYQQAISYCERALIAIRELGATYGEAAVWDSLGYTHHQLGDHRQAVRCYERAVGLYRDRADMYSEAETLSLLGDAHHSAGSADAARRAWSQALRMFSDLDHPGGDRVRAKLQPYADASRAAILAATAVDVLPREKIRT